MGKSRKIPTFPQVNARGPGAPTSREKQLAGAVTLDPMERGPVIPGVSGAPERGAVRDRRRRDKIYEDREAIGRCDRVKVPYKDATGEDAEMTTAGAD